MSSEMYVRGIPDHLGMPVAVDCETTGLYPWTGARPFLFTFCNWEGTTGYINWKVDPFTRKVIPKAADLAAMRKFFGNEKIVKAFHNSKFDIRMLQFSGIEVRGRVEDTLFASHILRDEPTYALKPLCKKYFDFSDEDEKMLSKAVSVQRRKGKLLGWKLAEEGIEGRDPVKADMWMSPLEDLLLYGVGDAERCMMLLKATWDDLRADPECWKFYNFELGLQKVTMEMEARGVKVNPWIIHREIALNRKIAAECWSMIQKECGTGFNPNSPVQLREYIYGKLGLEVTKWTKGGKRSPPMPSTDATVLRGIEHPVVQAIRKYATANDGITNFFQKYLDTSVKDEKGQWILHAEFNQAEAHTWRFSSRNPNLQQVPNMVANKMALEIRARLPFGPREGYEWWAFDYKGQELWIYADGANEEVMLKSLLAGEDVHGGVAIQLWGAEAMAEEKRLHLKKLRAKTKQTFFGLLYGMGLKGLAEFLKISRREAEVIMERYHAYFPRMSPYMEEMSSRGRRQGYIQNAWGRKIFVDPEFSYRATNYYVQSGGADLIKHNMIRLRDYFVNERVDAHLVMTIHDEVMIEISRKDLCIELVERIQDILGDHQGHLTRVPCRLPVEPARIRKDWGHKLEYDNQEEMKADLLARP